MVPRAFGHSPFSRQGRLLALGLAAALAAASAAARAEDPPGRVGSLNYVSGEVSYALRGETGEPSASEALSWTQADFDQPVSEDMSLRTGEKARARICIGPDAIEMSDETVLNILNLSDRLIEASVARGRIYLQIDKLAAGEAVEIEMRSGSLSLLATGGYDIEVGSGDAPTRVTVFDGKARFFGGAADAPVAAGEELRITGSYPAVTAMAAAATAANPMPATGPAAGQAPKAATAAAPPPAAGSEAAAAADRAAAGAPADNTGPPAAAAATPRPSDDFMYFVAESKSDTAATQSARYVSSETTGYDELDRYGHWGTLPDSEAVWVPDSVPADWAPYRFGHWDSIPPWGWTWVDDEPWGFAPFHYGRWINLDGRWGWVPGPVVADPVYAPALVAFVDPGGRDQGPDGADVGWFPLAPGDAYVPWYAAGPAYVERVNTGVRAGPAGGVEAWRAPFANRSFATVVTRGAFADGRPVQLAMARLPADRLAQAAMLHGAPHVAATPRPGARGEGAGERSARVEENRRPEISRNAAEHGRMPERERAAAARGPAEPHRGGQQFARPEGFRGAPAAYRGGVAQFRQPEAFRTPMSSFAGRGFQMPQFGGHAATQSLFGGHAAAPFGGGSFSRQK